MTGSYISVRAFSYWGSRFDSNKRPPRRSYLLLLFIKLEGQSAWVPLRLYGMAPTTKQPPQHRRELPIGSPLAAMESLTAPGATGEVASGPAVDNRRPQALVDPSNVINPLGGKRLRQRRHRLGRKSHSHGPLDSAPAHSPCSRLTSLTFIAHIKYHRSWRSSCHTYELFMNHAMICVCVVINLTATR